MRVYRATTALPRVDLYALLMPRLWPVTLLRCYSRPHLVCDHYNLTCTPACLPAYLPACLPTCCLRAFSFLRLLRPHLQIPLVCVPHSNHNLLKSLSWLPSLPRLYLPHLPYLFLSRVRPRQSIHEFACFRRPFSPQNPSQTRSSSNALPPSQSSSSPFHLISCHPFQSN